MPRPKKDEKLPEMISAGNAKPESGMEREEPAETGPTDMQHPGGAEEPETPEEEEEDDADDV